MKPNRLNRFSLLCSLICYLIVCCPPTLTAQQQPREVVRILAVGNSFSDDGVEYLDELAKAAGARRCIPLNVSGPFHTRLMAPAGDALARRFETESFGEMRVPVLFNCLGREKAAVDSIPALLVRQVQSSVYMEDTLHRLGELGVDHILEVGPGNALSGFVKKTLPGVTCVSVETPAQLDTVLNAWKEEQ